uniref:Uncharacterized protein n=1 Tax=Calidris pygmaea TaxID=425635 RepID=A0A8C3JR71_9CHAR
MGKKRHGDPHLTLFIAPNSKAIEFDSDLTAAAEHRKPIYSPRSPHPGCADPWGPCSHQLCPLRGLAP